jgi:hypothetical protein
MRRVSVAKTALILAISCLVITAQSRAEDYVLHTFRKIQLTDKFWSEGAAVADVNRDGHLDIISGPYWYEGPDFKRRHEIFPATHTFTLQKEDGTEVSIEGYEGALGKKNAYSHVFLEFAYDFNHDGWPDILTIDVPTVASSSIVATWYENPGKEGLEKGTSWQEHVAFDAMGNESPTLADLFGDGRPVLLCTSGDVLGYVAPDWNNPRNKWTFHAISYPLPMLKELREKFSKLFGGKPWPYSHGLGYGDVNGDGRQDILESEGWWEQPASVLGDPVWKFHKWPFLANRPVAAMAEISPDSITKEQVAALMRSYEWPFELGGAQIYVYDVNGDGLPDIVSSLNAHGHGLAWFEQLRARDSSGEIQFKPHILMGDTPNDNRYGVEFTQLHAVQLVDIDGDGLKDIVTGRRFWAHGPNGPDAESNGPAVLYWFKLLRGRNGSVDFVPYLIDTDSGVGTEFVTADVNCDGLPDIIIGNKKGTFLFLQEVKHVSRSEWERAQPKVEFPNANSSRP